ncbi:MAG: gliding motility-associated C-terminal domain-containing protein, partial [Saprospiraceae bacterium]
TYFVTVNDVDGCEAFSTVTIGQPEQLIMELTSQDVVCFGESNGSINIDTAYGGTPPYMFSLDNDIFQSDTILAFLTSDTYTVYIQDANGCIDSSVIFVNQPEELLVNAFPLDTIISLGESVDLNAIPNQDNTTIAWTPSDSLYLSCSDCPNPTASPVETTLYDIVVTDTINGCQTTAQIVIRVDKDRNVFIPNAFSPNTDGYNDFVTVYGDQSVASINYFRVFDRWGELVYENSNFPPNAPLNHGWDGRFKGKRMNPGVFVYVTEVLFIDGRTKVYKGDITLVD